MRTTIVPLIVADVAITVPLTVVFSLAEHQWIDGLHFPFLTQAAREGASFWVFAFGMTLLWPLLIALGHVTERWMRDVGVAMRLPHNNERFGHKVLACCCPRYERFGRAVNFFFSISGFFFALCAWTNHVFFHHARFVDVHAYGQVESRKTAGSPSPLL